MTNDDKRELAKLDAWMSIMENWKTDKPDNSILLLRRLLENEKEQNEIWEERFSRFWMAYQRGTERWRAAHPDKRHLEMPDLQDLTVHLLDEIDRLQKELQQQHECPLANAVIPHKGRIAC